VRSQIYSGPPGSRLTGLAYSSWFVGLGLTFQILHPGIGLFVQPIGQIRQVAISQCAAVRWDARHVPQAFCLLAK
jgi:hypothetical protein